MAEPRRWLQDEDAPREVLRLLRAAERPRPASSAKRVALVGVLASVAAQTPRAAWGLAWMKAALYSTAVVVTGATAITVAHRQAEVPAAVEPAAVRAAPIQAAPGPPPGQPVAMAEAPAPVPPTVARHVAARPRTAARVVKAPADTLAEEEALLEEARRQLSQSPSASLRLLRKHLERFPNGELTAERLFLSTDAAVRLHDAAGARQTAETLRARFPESAYARRVPALLGSLTPSRGGDPTH